MNNQISNNPRNEIISSQVASLAALERQAAESAAFGFHDAVAPRLPTGYFERSDGIYLESHDDAGIGGPIWICSPIRVIGLCSRSNGTGWSRVLELVDPSGRLHKVLLDEVLFNGPTAGLLRPLLNCGLRIARGPAAQQRVAELLSGWRPERTFVRISHAGWIDDNFDAFAFPDGLIVGSQNAIFDLNTDVVGEAAGANGSLETWQQTVASACVGNPLMLLAVSQAFVGPLLKPLGLEGGGFHFRGASSSGKTTLLKLAASVWGSPGFVQSWRSTDNALETTASSCSSALLALDELHMVAPKVAGDIVYMLANGRGKQRMATNGNAKPTATWHTAILSSGEITLEDHLASGGKTMHAGQEIRLINIEADGRKFGSFDVLHDETDPGLFVEKLVQATASNHGHVSRIFVKQLIDRVHGRGQLENFMNNCVEQLIKFHDLQLDGQVRRVLNRFALAALAGELATQFGLTGWTKGEAMNGIFKVASIWVRDRDTVKAALVQAALERTRKYLQENETRFVPCGSPGDVDGWRDQSWIYVRSETWSRIHGVEGAQEAARLHKAANMLRTDTGATLQFRMGRNVSGRPKSYAVNVRILESQQAAM